MKLEIYADVLCPWCYIGTRRLTAALAQHPGRDHVVIIWRSYELAPEAGRIPGPTAAAAMAGWWGEQAAARVARIRSLGSAEGLELNLDLARPVSTFDAHRLVKLAAHRGRAEQMMEVLLHAYHTEGLNVADAQVLRRLGGEAGLDGDEVRAVLSGDDYAEQVRDDRRRAAELGVTGVPSLVIDGRPPVSGVQPVADLQVLLGYDPTGSPNARACFKVTAGLAAPGITLAALAGLSSSPIQPRYRLLRNKHRLAIGAPDAAP